MRDALEHVSLVGRVHGLVDLVDHAEGRRVDGLQRDEVHHRRDGALAARVAPSLAQHVQRLIRAPLHFDVHLVLRKVVGALGLPRLWAALAPVDELDVAHAPEALEVRREVVVHDSDHLFELGFPVGDERVEVLALRLDLGLRVACSALGSLNLFTALLVVAERLAVIVVTRGDIFLERLDLSIELFQVAWHRIPLVLMLLLASAQA